MKCQITSIYHNFTGYLRNPRIINLNQTIALTRELNTEETESREYNSD